MTSQIRGAAETASAASKQPTAYLHLHTPDINVMARLLRDVSSTATLVATQTTAIRAQQQRVQNHEADCDQAMCNGDHPLQMHEIVDGQQAARTVWAASAT